MDPCATSCCSLVSGLGIRVTDDKVFGVAHLDWILVLVGGWLGLGLLGILIYVIMLVLGVGLSAMNA